MKNTISHAVLTRYIIQLIILESMWRHSKTPSTLHYSSHNSVNCSGKDRNIGYQKQYGLTNY